MPLYEIEYTELAQITYRVIVQADNENDALSDACNGFYKELLSKSVDDSDIRNEQVMEIRCEDCGRWLEEGQECADCAEEEEGEDEDNE